MPDETQSDEFDGLDVPQLKALATSLGIEFTPKARAATLIGLMRFVRARNAQNEVDRPAREAASEAARAAQASRLEADSARLNADLARRAVRFKELRASPDLRAEIIERKAETLRTQADRVRRYVRGIDPKSPNCDPDGTDADYLEAVHQDVALQAQGVEFAQRQVAKADALRDGLASKAGRQTVARARLRLAQAEHELAAARLWAATTDAPVEAPSKRRLMLTRSISRAAQ